jgi:hypothetical protein
MQAGTYAGIFSQKEKNITPETELKIIDVIESGEEDGIVCCLDAMLPDAYVISLTLLRIKPDHPLFDKISTYQAQEKKHFQIKGSEAEKAIGGGANALVAGDGKADSTSDHTRETTPHLSLNPYPAPFTAPSISFMCSNPRVSSSRSTRV